MRIKTIVLITLLFLSASSVPRGYIDLLRIQSFTSNNYNFSHKAINSNAWKSINRKTIRVSNNVDHVTNIASSVNAHKMSLPVGTLTGNINQLPALAIAKTADPLTYSAVDEVIDYSFVVTNTDIVTLYDITVMDDITIDESCPDTSAGLAPGASITCRASYTITQADLDAGSVTNSAYATDGFTNSEPDTAIVKAVQLPALVIAKTADPLTYSAVNDVIDYSFVVTNTGNVILYDISVEDDITIDESCPDTSAGLAPAASITCSASYTITQADLNAGSVTNSAYATDGSTNSEPDTALVTAVQLPALAIAKTADPLTYDQPGQVITYTYLVTNTGNVTLYTITVVDDKATVTCPDTSAGLAPLVRITCTAPYTITQADLNAGSVTNTAYATDGTTQSNPDSKTITADQLPALTIAKTADPLTYDTVGDIIGYEFVVTNSGNLSLLGPVTVSDNKATDEACPAVSTVGNLDGYLDPGESLTCTASYTITQDDLNTGSVNNIASASADGTTSPTDTATVTADQLPALTIAKTADPLTYDQPGQVITYTYLMTNSGNVSISSPFTVFDDKTSNEDCPSNPTSLNPGQSITCTASYIIQRKDMTSGFVTNFAYATAMFGNITVLSNLDTETITATHIVIYTFVPIVNMSKPGVQVLPVSYQYVSHNTQFIIGEISNNTINSLTWVDITVNYFDSNGIKLGTSHAYLWPLHLPAWERGCFKISSDILNWSYYEFEAPAYDLEGTSPNLVVIDHSGSYDPISGDYRINGQVVNHGNQRSENVGVSGTLYNSSGVPVACDYNYVNGVNLDPNQTNSFTISFLGNLRDYADVTHYRLRVAGDLP
jgi:uncharacterized repeat protein (TIGR01451 family)